MFLVILLFLFVAFSSLVYAVDVNETVLIDSCVPFIENQGQADQSVS